MQTKREKRVSDTQGSVLMRIITMVGEIREFFSFIALGVWQKLLLLLLIVLSVPDFVSGDYFQGIEDLFIVVLFFILFIYQNALNQALEFIDEVLGDSE